MNEAPSDQPLPPKLKRPSTFGRITALAMGTLIFIWLGQVGHMVTEVPFPACLLVVIAGAAAIMVVLTVFGVKAFEGRESLRRFNLSSLMLVTVPLAIYLAGFRVLLSRAPTDEFTPLIWIMLGVMSLLAMAVATMFLMAMAEAILWAATLPVVRRKSKGPRNDTESPREA